MLCHLKYVWWQQTSDFTQCQSVRRILGYHTPCVGVSGIAACTKYEQSYRSCLLVWIVHDHVCISKPTQLLSCMVVGKQTSLSNDSMQSWTIAVHVLWDREIEVSLHNFRPRDQVFLHWNFSLGWMNEFVTIYHFLDYTTAMHTAFGDYIPVTDACSSTYQSYGQGWGNEIIYLFSLSNNIIHGFYEWCAQYSGG